MTLTELSERIDITLANLSILKTNKARAIRFSTLEAICRDGGIGRASILGIGSLNGARFESGLEMESYASEFLITGGRLEETPDGARVRLDIAVVDMDGAIFHGRLVRGQNPVCVTAELVVLSELAVALSHAD